MRFARAEHGLDLRRAFVQTLAPVPIIALLLLPRSVLPTSTLSLDLDALRLLAERIGRNARRPGRCSPRWDRRLLDGPRHPARAAHQQALNP